MGWGHLKESGAVMWCMKCGRKHKFAYGHQGDMSHCFEHLCGGKLVGFQKLPEVVESLRGRLKARR